MEKISKPFEYAGYSSAEYTGYKRTPTYVEMSDKGHIATDVYLPDGYIGKEKAPLKFPVIFIFTPYNRATIHPDTNEVIPTSNARPGEGIKGYFEHGYAVVIADLRNCGATKDEALTFGFRYQKDCGEMVDWIAEQSWSNGNVGMVGGSHVGWTQLAAAGQKPGALKAIMPAVVPFDAFTGQFYPGGIFMKSFMTGFSQSEVIKKELDKRAEAVCAPVLDQNGRAVSMEKKRENPDDQIDPDNQIVIDVEDNLSIDSKMPTGETIKDLCSNMIPPIANTDIAIYNLGGWFDGFIRGTFEIYATLARTNPSRIAVFPGFHDLVNGFVYDDFKAKVPDLVSERLRFFDHYLKGIDNGIDKQPPVLIYNMHGDGWRLENEWPLARQGMQKFYLSENNTFADSAEDKGSDSYQVNFSQDMRYGKNLSSRWTGLTGISPAASPDMTAKDTDNLCYTGQPFDNDTEVTGHPVVKLWVSSSADNGDFYLFLEDVDEKGRTLMVTEGQLRSDWAGLYDNNEMTDHDDIEILPKLPWHGYTEAQKQENGLAENKIIELTVDLLPTSWVFKKGHSIRLSISGANWPDFQLHPKLSPSNDPKAEDNIEPVVKVHRGSSHPSVLELPIVPQKKDKYSAD